MEKKRVRKVNDGGNTVNQYKEDNYIDGRKSVRSIMSSCADETEEEQFE